MSIAADRSGWLHANAPFRVGIWCDYGFTILPDEGIGVLVYNLIQGFLRLEEPLEVVLLVSPGDQKKVASFTGKYARLLILSKLDGMPAWWTALRGFLTMWVRWSDRVNRGKQLIMEWTRWFQNQMRQALARGLKSWAGWIPPMKVLAAVGGVIVVPIIVLLLWVG